MQLPWKGQIFQKKISKNPEQPSGYQWGEVRRNVGVGDWEAQTIRCKIGSKMYYTTQGIKPMSYSNYKSKVTFKNCKIFLNYLKRMSSKFENKYQGGLLDKGWIVESLKSSNFPVYYWTIHSDKNLSSVFLYSYIFHFHTGSLKS